MKRYAKNPESAARFLLFAMKKAGLACSPKAEVSGGVRIAYSFMGECGSVNISGEKDFSDVTVIHVGLLKNDVVKIVDEALSCDS